MTTGSSDSDETMVATTRIIYDRHNDRQLRLVLKTIRSILLERQQVRATRKYERTAK